MNRRLSPMSEVNMMASLADLKEVDYQNTLLLTALIDLLIEKNVLTQRDLVEKIKQLDQFPTSF
ncbi:MAG TPA: hypothetical protein DDY49_10870 [Paenibacillaceae bacterium]|nr:hypothetical protein [Paenibacillaceae bacterium]